MSIDTSREKQNLEGKIMSSLFFGSAIPAIAYVMWAAYQDQVNQSFIYDNSTISVNDSTYVLKDSNSVLVTKDGRSLIYDFETSTIRQAQNSTSSLPVSDEGFKIHHASFTANPGVNIAIYGAGRDRGYESKPIEAGNLEAHFAKMAGCRISESIIAINETTAPSEAIYKKLLTKGMDFSKHYCFE
jgi:hypothetical protein